MTVVGFRPAINPSSVPESVKHLDLDDVEAAMIRHGARVTDAARELGVPISDLRKLCFAVPRLMDVAFEHEERRLDLAEKRIDEALKSDDSRRHDAAAMFVLRNSAKSKKRGWIPVANSSVDVSLNLQSTRTITYRWRGENDPDPAELRDEPPLS